MRRALVIALASLALAAPLLAQGDPQAVAERSSREMACLRPLQSQLADTLELLREARAQMDMAHADPRARQDAAQAVEALEQRIRSIVVAMQACIEAPGPTPIEVVEDTPSHAAEEANDPLPTVDAPRALSDNVRVVSAYRVDGVGTVPSDALQAGVSGIGGRMDRCYQRLVRRGALARGRGVLAFSVNPQGRVGRVETEAFTIESSTFERCVKRAGGHIRLRTGSNGGISRYAYTFEFGPEG